LVVVPVDFSKVLELPIWIPGVVGDATGVSNGRYG
jgi:hypothetical protein